jgi:hypothetical protein
MLGIIITALREWSESALPNNINRRAKETFIIRIIMKEAQNKRERLTHTAHCLLVGVRFASACFIFTLNLRMGIFSLQLIARASENKTRLSKLISN